MLVKHKKNLERQKEFQFPMNYVRPPSMYRPRKEMKARNNMRKCVQRTQLQILRKIQNKKQSKAQQVYKMTDTKFLEKKL